MIFWFFFVKKFALDRRYEIVSILIRLTSRRALKIYFIFFFAEIQFVNYYSKIMRKTHTDRKKKNNNLKSENAEKERKKNWQPRLIAAITYTFVHLFARSRIDDK